MSEPVGSAWATSGRQPSIASRLPFVEWFRAHPRVADVLFMAVVAFLSLATVEGDPEGSERAMDVGGWLLIAAMNLPLATRRIYPVATAWFIVLATMVFWIADYPPAGSGFSVLVALYGLGAYASRPRSIRHFVALFAIMISVQIAGLISDEEDLPWLAIPTASIVLASAWILGDNLQTRRQYLAELEDKAARAEVEREAESRRAVTNERNRIARELHDVVAHSMSVMVVQAGAARRVLRTDEEQAEVALRAIEETGRGSLTEMRRVLGVLRSDDDHAELAPAPTFDDFDRLLKSCEEAGLPVELSVDGENRTLAPGLELSAYRVVQESLTNVLKHAGPTRARVALTYEPSTLVVDVTDDGAGAAAANGGGQGLIGMRERVEAYGGELQAGPRRGGGYQVTARFPIEA